MTAGIGCTMADGATRRPYQYRPCLIRPAIAITSRSTSMTTKN